MKIFSILILLILGSVIISLIGVKLLHLEGMNLKVFCLIFGLINGALIGNFFGKN